MTVTQSRIPGVGGGEGGGRHGGNSGLKEVVAKAGGGDGRAVSDVVSKLGLMRIYRQRL
jgi:hypothetical protein